MILLRPQEYNEKLLACCIHVFDEGKYDENVLAYLEQFYQAKSDKMMKVWRACAGFRVPCQTLAERILVERLFTGNLSGRIPEVFTYYRQQLPDSAVEMAYLAENAYRYFVKHETADEQVFTCIGGYLLENKKMPPVCGMAYLKYHTQFGQEQLGGTHMLLLQKLMDMLCAENISENFKKTVAIRSEMWYNKFVCLQKQGYARIHIDTQMCTMYGKQLFRRCYSAAILWKGRCYDNQLSADPALGQHCVF